MPERRHPEEAWKLTASEALESIRNGQLSVEDYAKSLLSRIGQRDATVKAWVHLNRDLILQRARELDALPQEARGPLHGVPIGIKDIILTQDMPTQYNSRLFESSTPIGVDAPVVTVLRKAGALIFGKTTTTEFAATHQGDTHQNLTSNPHDSKRTPGGSSSGSAAAVADYHVPIALGTQTAGSMIRPGSFCGVYAIKPTWGAVSRENVAQYSFTNDTVGFFARSAEDLELLSPVFKIEDDQPRLFQAKGAKVAFLKTHVWPKAGPGLQAAWKKAKELLVQEGAEVEETRLPADFESIPHWHDIILAGEGKSSFLGAYVADKTLLHATMRNHVENTKGFSRSEQLEAYDKCAGLRPVWDRFAAEFDAVIVPSVPDEAPEGLDYTGSPVFCSMWTILHAPVLTMPGFAGESGMPVGLSVVGPRFEDQSVVNVAKVIGPIFERAGGWKPKNSDS